MAAIYGTNPYKYAYDAKFEFFAMEHKRLKLDASNIFVYFFLKCLMIDSTPAVMEITTAMIDSHSLMVAMFTISMDTEIIASWSCFIKLGE